jgi:hypothetical protein
MATYRLFKNASNPSCPAAGPQRLAQEIAFGGSGWVASVTATRGFAERSRTSASTSAWKTFLKAHWGAVAAADFFRVEGLTRGWRGSPAP